MEDKKSIWKIASECSFEVKTLEDISVSILTGSLPKVIEQKIGNVPVIKVGDISGLKNPYVYECKTFLDDSNIKNKKIAKYGDILMIYKSGSNNLVGKIFLYLGKYNCVIGKNIYIIKHNQNSRYLFHILNVPEIQQQIKVGMSKKHMHGLLFRIRLEDLKNISVPIPSLENQKLISDYLDDLFLSKIKIEESLNLMIKLRKKQYEYYKEKLLLNEMNKWDDLEVIVFMNLNSEIYKEVSLEYLYI